MAAESLEIMPTGEPASATGTIARAYFLHLQMENGASCAMRPDGSVEVDGEPAPDEVFLARLREFAAEYQKGAGLHGPGH